MTLADKPALRRAAKSLLRPAYNTLFRPKYISMKRRGARRTSDAALLNLIQKLKPQDCGVDLIRIGGSNDGGYLIPDDLEGIEYCFSPGVSTVSDFENQIADRGIQSYLADYSVEKPFIMRPEFVFDKKFLGGYDHDMFFTLATWKNQYLKDYSGDLLLQMDIEGGEYEVILSTPESLLSQFRIIVIEFHEMDRLFDALIFRLLSPCFEKLLRSFEVVHIHPNNYAPVESRGRIQIPPILEFTFLNKRRVKSITPRVNFPHELDADNTGHRHIALPKCWYV